MRLLRRVQPHGTTTASDLSLHQFDPPKVPPEYAILSHRWGPDEVTLKDVENGIARIKAGSRKLEFCATQAACDGIAYFWIDTCCIDKANNTELSEAINSMFKWYRNASKCYVYLPDVSTEDCRDATLEDCIWGSSFRRGWTLQALIAPPVDGFFSLEGKRIGDKKSLEREICHITQIPVEVLRGQSLPQFGFDEQLLWAARRDTTREEDSAHCLLGIFNVFMPLIYGEGRENAMARLKSNFRSSQDAGLPRNELTKEQKCHQVFKTSSYEVHKDRNPSHVTGTREWVLSHPQFCDWRSGQTTRFCGFLLTLAVGNPFCANHLSTRTCMRMDELAYAIFSSRTMGSRTA